MTIINKTIETKIAAFIASRGGTAAAAIASDVRDYIEGAAAADIDITGPDWEGLFIKGGLVFFHSRDGEPTGIPTAVRLIQALDVEALRRLKARFEAKFNP